MVRRKYAVDHILHPDQQENVDARKAMVVMLSTSEQSWN